MLEVNCPGCAKLLRLKDELQGRKVGCPKCGAAFRIGTPDGEDILDAEVVEEEVLDAEIIDDDIIEDVEVERKKPRPRKSLDDVFDIAPEVPPPPPKKKKRRRAARVASNDPNPIFVMLWGFGSIVLGIAIFCAAVYSFIHPFDKKDGTGTIYIGGLVFGPSLVIYGFNCLQQG